MGIKLCKRADLHGNAVAFRVGTRQHTYTNLFQASKRLAGTLLNDCNDIQEARIAFLLPSGADYVATQWGIWLAGGIAVPLSHAATEKELEYSLRDSGVSRLVANRECAGTLRALCTRLDVPVIVFEELRSLEHRVLPEISSERGAMILYTSGTTSKPKGVVTTHANIEAQIKTLVDAWHWHASDVIPLFLPLHHIHGIINVMSCALWTGATIEPFPQFDLDVILRRVADCAYTVFMAVPTIYVKLIQGIEAMPPETRLEVIKGFAQMRLMVSGSAALPASVHEKWTELTGQKLLERYGMTEIGMALSNPYQGERRPGAVGIPLPGVEVRLKTERGNVITEENEPGEIQVRGPGVFLEYWNRPEATAASFDSNWFCTGDVATVERGYYRIMGRSSIDIIKSGGYKLSALEIEAALLDHPVIRECAVVGLEDETWGETVAAAVVVADGQSLQLQELKYWCHDRLSPYKIPKTLLCVDQLPRNAMGKVTKSEVIDLFQQTLDY